MPTYAESAAKRERAGQRRAQDRRDAIRHASFDLSAQDLHHKHDRAHFAVVGEGSAAAQTRYRRGWDRIFGGHHRAA